MMCPQSRRHGNATENNLVTALGELSGGRGVAR